jgi:hypothetical protein
MRGTVGKHNLPAVVRVRKIGETWQLPTKYRLT